MKAIPLALLLGSAVTGALVGVFVALSDTPLAGTALGTLLTLITGYLAAGGWKGEQHSATAVLGVAAFSLGVLIALFPAIDYRDKRLAPKSLEAQRDELKAVFGADTEKILLVRMFGAVPGGVQGRPYDTEKQHAPVATERGFVLRAKLAEVCDRTDFDPETSTFAQVKNLFAGTKDPTFESLATLLDVQAEKNNIPAEDAQRVRLAHALAKYTCSIAQ